MSRYYSSCSCMRSNSEFLIFAIMLIQFLCADTIWQTQYAIKPTMVHQALKTKTEHLFSDWIMGVFLSREYSRSEGFLSREYGRSGGFKFEFRQSTGRFLCVQW